MKLLSVKEAAARLGISDRRVRILISNGKLKAHKLGREHAIEEQDLEGVVVYGKAGRPPKQRKEAA